MPLKKQRRKFVCTLHARKSGGCVGAHALLAVDRYAVSRNGLDRDLRTTIFHLYVNLQQNGYVNDVIVTCKMFMAPNAWYVRN